MKVAVAAGAPAILAEVTGAEGKPERDHAVIGRNENNKSEEIEMSKKLNEQEQSVVRVPVSESVNVDVDIHIDRIFTCNTAPAQNERPIFDGQCTGRYRKWPNGRRVARSTCKLTAYLHAILHQRQPGAARARAHMTPTP